MQKTSDLVGSRESLRESQKLGAGLKLLLHSEFSLPIVIPLSFAFWIVVVFFFGGGWAAVNLLAYAFVALAGGYSIIGVATPSYARSQRIVFAPAIGVLVISAVTALWVRLGFPLIWSIVLWLGLAAAGCIALWRDRNHWRKSTVPYGLSLVFFSGLICAVYFLPSARNDLVNGRDGSFKWMFIDSQHFHAIAASIKSSGSPPKTPGTGTAELLYHFAPYAPAAEISRIDGLDLGDAVARVTRGTSLWALVLSCFGLGTLLSLRATGKSFGGIMSVAGLFFYGSLSALFTDERTTLGHLAKAIIFNIPMVEVQADGGPFNHLLGGHSVLHGLVAITAIMGLSLAERESETVQTLRKIALLALPALAVPMNLEASVYCLGVAGILLFWGRLGTPRSWALLAFMVISFLATWSVMGYSHSQDAGLATINGNPAGQWWPLAVWFIVGLGFRVVGLRWISSSFKDPVSALVLISLVGWLAFSLLIHLRDENERYGIYFLQSIFSIFAFSRLTAGCWRGVERSKLIADWLTLVRKSLVILLSGALLLRIIIFFLHSHAWIASLRLQIVPALLLLLLVFVTLAIMKKGPRPSRVCSAVVMGVLLIGFLAWIPTWYRFGLQTVPTDVTSSPGEVRGLLRLRELMASDERFATNKHFLDRLKPLEPLALSYGYSALSERTVLLEGYLARGEKTLPWFNNLLHDNDLMFSTTDADTLRRTAQIWHVRWLVARPGTDIALPRPLPRWLAEQQNCGDLKVYRID